MSTDAKKKTHKKPKIFNKQDLVKQIVIQGIVLIVLAVIVLLGCVQCVRDIMQAADGSQNATSHNQAIDYEMPKVNITASVKPDGSVDVVEERTFDFEDNAQGVYWLLPHDDTHKILVQDVELVDANGMTLKQYVRDFNNSADLTQRGITVFAAAQQMFGPFVVQDAQDSQKEYFSVSSENDTAYKLKIFQKTPENTKTTFRIHYTIDNLACAYQDTAELYWKFVSDGWQVESKNVSCTIVLPKPQDVKLSSEQNVKVWGHGTQGQMTIHDDTIEYSVPAVPSEQFAEARVLFPSAWLSEVTPLPEAKYQAILNEEARNTRKTNFFHQLPKLLNILFFVFLAVLFVRACVTYSRYRKEHKSRFDDVYFRDMPSQDSPLLIAALFASSKRKSLLNGDIFAAGLLRLSQAKIISLEYVQEKSLLGKNVPLLVLNYADYKHAKAAIKDRGALDKIDAAIAKFLFRDMYNLIKKEKKKTDPEGMTKAYGRYITQEGYPCIQQDAFKKLARNKAGDYEYAFNTLKNTIDAQIRHCRYFSDGRASAHKKILNTPVVIVGAIGAFVSICSLGYVLARVNLLLYLIVYLSCRYFDARMPRFSKEATEVVAKTRALKKWFKDFTRLDEALPKDAILWDKLLVMATALGVADKVIKQLELADPELIPVYSDAWFDSDGAASGFSHGFNQGAPSASASSGSGGGFSSGGGGGFGGGGGGGAF